MSPKGSEHKCLVMSYFQGRDRRKESGGAKKAFRKKRKRELGSPPTETILEKEEERYIERTFGGPSKNRVKSAVYANLTDASGSKVKKVKISRVVSNPASVDYSRRGVITRGAVIETEEGRAKVTSRPGQTGVVNAILIPTKQGT